ncbi:MAG: flagellar biosynthesis protein FliQ [Nitrospinae bacterium]|nr:flagellar biosynthesis protein FliQ [Nitrospinota bacterium]
MTESWVLGFGREAIELTLMLSAPMLGFGLVTGILISIFQAVTSIQEMTLTFIPKILMVFLALLLFFPWLLQSMMGFTVRVFQQIPNIIR